MECRLTYVNTKANSSSKRCYETRTSPFVKLQIHTGMFMMGLIGLVAGCFEDLAECWERTSWWVVPICTNSPSKIFQSHHLLIIMGEDYRHFRLRPQGIIEILCGEGSTHSGYSVATGCHRLASSYLAILNPHELRNRLVGLENGFYLQIEVTGNFRLGREILLTPYRLVSTLHEAPPPSIYRRSSECYSVAPGQDEHFF